ncbi:MAG: permease prefix domain 1-containing protein [Planctomycetota bacterium]
MSAASGWIGPRKESAPARALHDDVRAELESHIELCVDELVEAGETPERARQTAEARFGDIDVIAGRCLAEKNRGAVGMKGLVAVLVIGLGLTVVAFATLSVRARQAAVEREMAARLVAEERAVELAQRRPALLGQDDVPSPGDRVQVTTMIAGGHEAETEATVDAGGMILLPEVGRLLVTDKTRLELEQWVNAAYDQYYADLPRLYVVLERPALR